MDTKNILYLTYDGLKDPLGQSQILPYLNKLSKKGFNISIISFEKKDADNAIHLSKEINWHPLKYHKKPPVLSTIFDLIMLYRYCIKILNQKRIDIVHCRSYVPALIGLKIKRKLGVKLVFDIRGFWIEERVEGGIWNLRNPIFHLIYYYFKRKEKQLFNMSDHIVSLTVNAKNQIVSQYKRFQDKDISDNDITVIPTCVDVQLFDPKNINTNRLADLRISLNLDKKDLVLLYHGSLGTWYLFKEMIEFYEDARKTIPNLKFLILTREIDFVNKYLSGSGYSLINTGTYTFCSEISSLYRYSDGRHNSKISESQIILSQSKYILIPYYIFLSSASILFYRPGYSRKATFATKLGEILAMGKPIITNSGWGDIDRIITNGKEGWVLKTLYKGKYSEPIEFLNNTSKLNPANLRQIALESFSLDYGVSKITQIYNRL